MSRSPCVPIHGRGAQRRQRRRSERYLVVSGGEVTETQYFEHLKTTFNIEIVPRSKPRSPNQLADFAIRLKEEQEGEPGVDPYAQVWVVVDVDDFHDHHRAERKCSDNGIRLVISNPCFEVWLIDHVCACPDSYVLTRGVERYAAEKGITTGKNHKYIEFSAIDGKYDDAVNNANRHNTSTRLVARRKLAPGQERAFAPWTDMTAVMHTMRKQLSHHVSE